MQNTFREDRDIHHVPGEKFHTGAAITRNPAPCATER